MNLSTTRKSPLVLHPLVKLATAQLRLSLNDQARTSQGGFGKWLEEVTPWWDWKPVHFRYSRWYLNRVTNGHIKRLMNFWPVRHGKTEQNTVRYAAYRMELDPTMHIMAVAHTQSLATKISRKVKKIVQERVAIAKDKRSGPEWETVAGGSFRAMGVGGVGGGYGADLIILDDVIKNRKEANSPTYRDRMWDSWKDDISTRLHPGASVLATFTRWHEDDLAGRILESEDGPNWTVVKLPALAEENDPLGRNPGEALWPSQWDEAYLRERQVAMGDSFEPVYQQNPVPPGGKMFKRHWFNVRWNELPAGCKFVRYWDKAGTKDGTGAATAGVLMARTPDAKFVICDVVWFLSSSIVAVCGSKPSSSAPVDSASAMVPASSSAAIFSRVPMSLMFHLGDRTRTSLPLMSRISSVSMLRFSISLTFFRTSVAAFMFSRWERSRILAQ